ncbi:hypothetical protein, partial [Shewanella sp. Sh95]|uniref:hypothetical protein n=1 Tax=Shewanella sp. Sh95 TaxID=1689868 RepID=UPI000ABB1EA2
RKALQDGAILAKRKKVLEAAKERKPMRWSTEIRNCEAVGAVTVIPHLIFDLKNLTAIGHSDLLLSFAGNSSWPLPLSLSVTST